ncbi:MAG: GxxExxY protein [Chthoniobacterales bacterium]
MDVLNELKPGSDEKLYERARALELQDTGHNVETQRSFPVYFRQHLIGNLIPDLIVGDTIIVDAKVVGAFTDAHVAQMIGYLAISGMKLALLLNFKSARLEWKRVVHEQQRTSETADLHG